MITMKFLVVGLGSMGKRRIRNLKQLQLNNIIGFDTRKDRCVETEEKFKIKTYEKIEDAINQQPNMMIISTPPDLHMKYAKIAIDNNMNFFTEVNILQDEMLEVITKVKEKSLIGFPSCTMLFHPILKRVQKYLENEKIGKPLAFIYHCGMYLPDWHPWEDYRNFYVSKRITGACREIVPFELLWMKRYFGEISNVIARKTKISDLDADIDDIYNILLEFKNGIQGNFTMDVVSRFPFRQLKILCENGVILADWSDRTVKYYTKDTDWISEIVDDGKIEENYIHGDGPYVEELKNFVDAVNKKSFPENNFETDYKILKILEKIEKSSDLGTMQEIDS